MILPKFLLWGDVGKQKIQALIIICLCMYIYIFHISQRLYDKYKIEVDEFCLYECNTPLCKNIVKNSRDSGYFLHDKLYEADKCGLTWYEITHVIFHIFIGYYYNIYVSLGVGIGFEIFERYKFNNGSYLDILYNMLGFVIGYNIRK